MKISYKNLDGHLVIDKEILAPVEFNCLIGGTMCARFNDAHDEYAIPMSDLYEVTE